MDAFVTFRLPGLCVIKPNEAEPSTLAKNPSILPPVSDEALMDRVSFRTGEALSTLFRRYARLVRALAYKILGDDSDADDTVQEVFLFIHRKSTLFDSAKSSARSWIVQVTYHRAIDRRRYLQSRHFYTQVDLEDVMQGLEDGGPKTDAIECGDVLKLLNTLSEWP
jgi:RNA polymerase sigma-70 factor (ECF subfamily)